MLTEIQFKAQTRLSAKGLRRGLLRDIRGANIQPIDNHLASYDLVKNGANTAAKATHLSAVLTECARWLKLKKTKNGTSTTSRRGVITQLANDAFTELRNLNRAGGTDFYNLNKAITTGGQVNYNSKALGAGYINERNVYLAHGKAQNPPAAGPLHSTFDDMVRDGLPARFRTPEVQQILTKQFGTLTPQEFEVIAGVNAKLSGAANVQFATKADRSANLMVVYQGYNADFEDFHGAAFDTQTDPAGFMYAMDEYGTLFAAPAQNTFAHGNYWNHSSFNAGKDVVCAGMIKIHAGVLQYVDNDSGHYRPTRANLHQMITVLSGEGIALAAVTVMVKEPALMPGHVNIHTLNGGQFLANQNLLDNNFVTVRSQ